ncbi:MAG: type IV secretory system conjugative DNA transfer family protein, partial [Bdellovibrionales bacterium]|nr:type IV secretory system conjugative DNA transfer family protein [Bdellovibrionales bacterium]
RPKPISDHGTAHWADETEVKESGLLAGRGIIVGAIKERRRIKLLQYDGEGHVIVISPTRSGKGVSVVVPTALTWEHSVLFNDIKGELWALTAGWRKEKLDSVCLRFDATCEDGSAARWNPLYEIRPYPHDVRDAHNISLTLSVSESNTVRSDNERHWRTMGGRLIKAAILHQLYAGRDKTLSGCYYLLTSVKEDINSSLQTMLSSKHDPTGQFNWIDSETGKKTKTHPAVAHTARDMLNKSDREQSAIVSSAISYLEAFDDPIMAANISESDFCLSDLMQHEKPVSLYLTTPVADLERVQSLHRLFFTLAGTRNTEHLEFKEGQPAPKYKHRLLQVFDECAHLGYSPIIQKHFSLAGGYGIQGLFVFQDLSQLFDLYGRNESITSNCDIKVAFAPNNLDTANYFSRLLGTETRIKSDDGKWPNKCRAKAPKQSFGRPLLTPDECARLPQDKSIILKNGLAPILGYKVPYYEMPPILERSKIPAPKSDKILHLEPRWWELISTQEKPTRKKSPKSSTKDKATTARRKKKPKTANNNQQIDLFPIVENTNRSTAK